LVERFINGVGSADDEARGIDLVELDGGVELVFDPEAYAIESLEFKGDN
jgi:hypothetical protein